MPAFPPSDKIGAVLRLPAPVARCPPLTDGDPALTVLSKRSATIGGDRENMVMKRMLAVGIFATILPGAVGAQAADIDAGKAYFNKNCAVCHGRTAKGMASFPSLRDRDAEYLANRLETYRARGKVGSNSALMYSHAGKLDDGQITDIAGYLAASFGTAKPEPKAPKTKAEEPEPKAQKKAEPKPASSVPTAKDKPEKAASIACAQEKGQVLGKCSYRVTQGKDGKTTVTAEFANGFKRMLYFKDGKFEKASATMSGVGTDTDWRLEEDVHHIRVDDQQYEIPSALLAAHVKKADTTPDAKDDAASAETASKTDIAKGKKQFRKDCRGCHGAKAQGVASYPRLSGQPAEYLIERLEQYRAGKKLGPNTPLMAPRAKKLSDQDIADVVAYIETL
jgi:cytochrome c553